MLQILARVLWAAYLVCLTYLLTDHDPLQLLREEPEAFELLELLRPATHFAMFAILTVLTLAARLAWPRWLIAAFLIAYAVATEAFQLLVPPRQPDLADGVQNLLGIFAGYLFCFAAVSLRQRIASRLSRFWPSRPPRPPADSWDAMVAIQRVHRRPWRATERSRAAGSENL